MVEAGRCCLGLQRTARRESGGKDVNLLGCFKDLGHKAQKRNELIDEKWCKGAYVIGLFFALRKIRNGDMNGKAPKSTRVVELL
jgi:hypothetical protein